MLPYAKDDILDLAGQVSYDRGVDYIDNVTELTFDGTEVTATVEGTGVYEVNLSLDNGLDGSCDCPYGAEGNFCKHCVAVALVYLYHAEHGTLTMEATDPGGIADYLASLDHAELVDLLLEAADRDTALRQRLQLRAIGRAGAALDTDHAIGHIDKLLAVDGYVEYREASDYADRVYDLITWLTDRYEAGHDTLPLVQYALRALGEAFSSIDDSSGHVGGAAGELAALHAQICAGTRPTPQALADWLLDFQTAGFDWPNLDLDDYTDPLGTAGLAHYGERLTALWRALPGDGPDHRSHQIVRLMESWARARDDVDLLVTVLSTDRRYGVAYQRIVDVLSTAGRHAEALDWAERGIADSRHRIPESLVEFVVTRYTQDGRTADVLALRREQLRRTRSLAAYRSLRAAAEAAGDWPGTRTWALDLLRPAGDAAQRAAVQAWQGNVLVDVLLWEGEAEAAWTAAHRYAATDPQWLRLAEARGTTHPQDAIPVYQRIIDKNVEARSNETYARAADLAARVKALYDRLDEPDAAEQATAYFTRLRAAHKPKRNFMAELNRRGLP